MITVGATILCLVSLSHWKVARSGNLSAMPRSGGLRRRYLHHLALGPGLLSGDFLSWSQVDYVDVTPQKGSLLPAKFPIRRNLGPTGPLRRATKITARDSRKPPVGRTYQIPRTIYSEDFTILSVFSDSARHQRPHVRVRVAWRHRPHGGLLRGPGLLHHPFSVLQALRAPWLQHK